MEVSGQLDAPAALLLR